MQIHADEAQGRAESNACLGMNCKDSQLARAAIAQLAARRSHNPKVVSSILTRRIFGMTFNCRIMVQRAEIQFAAPKSDPGGTRTCNLWFRRPTPYPLSHRAKCNGEHVQSLRTCHRHERRLTMNKERSAHVSNPAGKARRHKPMAVDIGRCAADAKISVRQLEPLERNA